MAFAESCTGGLLSAAVTSVSGSSKVFTMGLITYSNQAKIDILKVPKSTIGGIMSVKNAVYQWLII